MSYHFVHWVAAFLSIGLTVTWAFTAFVLFVTNDTDRIKDKALKVPWRRIVLCCLLAIVSMGLTGASCGMFDVCPVEKKARNEEGCK